MIQAVNSVNTNSYKNQNVNFGTKNAVEDIGGHKKPSRAKAIAAYTGGQFAAGAIISTILNVGSNLVQKFKKVPNKEKIMSGSNIAKSAAFMGAMFVLIGLVVDGVFSLMYRNKNKNQ